MKKRVVVTGIGAVTPVGHGKDKFWASIKEGKCGIDRVTRFDASQYTCQVAAEVKDFDVEDYVDKKRQEKWIGLLTML